MQDQRKNINENYKEEQNKQKETNFSSLKPKEEQKPQTTLTAKEIKKRILRSFDNGELDGEAIEALKKLNHQNRANLTEEEKNQLDKELVDRELYAYGSKRDILEKVIDLIAKGADVNAQNDEDGWTALHFAAKNNYTKIAELLLKYGANPNAQIEEGNWKGQTALHIAANRNNLNLAELLLKYGANPNAQDKDGRTALHFAAFDNHPHLAELLLKHGANPNIQIKGDYLKGWTALHFAAYYNYTNLAELLLKYGANPNAQIEEGNWKGWTALHFAAYNNHPYLAELLLKHGANIFIIDHSGETPLTLAIKGYKEYENASEKENIETRRRYLEVINLLLTELPKMGFNIDKSLDEIYNLIKKIGTTLKNGCNEKIASSIKQRIEQ